MNRRTTVLAVLIVIGIGAAYIRIDYAFAYVLAILPSLLDQFGLLESKGEKAAEQRKMEFAREKLRAYSTFDQMLSELLYNSGQRFQVGVVTGMRTVYASLQVIEKIDNLLQKEAYLFDQLTKDYWRESKLTIYSGVNPGQDIVVDLADKLQTRVKDEIEKLKETLNLK